MQELTFDELNAVFGGNTTQDIGAGIMAIGAAGAGAGALTGQPEIVAVSTVIAGVGGVVYLAGTYFG